MFSPALLRKAYTLLQCYRKQHTHIATAESCTGGLLTALLTEIPGASDVIERGFITYSNQAKTELLGVEESLLLHYGAVSKETALSMATGALAASKAEVSIAITGIAGPGGATNSKPLGLVHIASHSVQGKTLHQEHIFKGNRSFIRLQAVEAAVMLLMAMCDGS